MLVPRELRELAKNNAIASYVLCHSKWTSQRDNYLDKTFLNSVGVALMIPRQPSNVEGTLCMHVYLPLCNVAIIVSAFLNLSDIAGAQIHHNLRLQRLGLGLRSWLAHSTPRL